jgi:hypothetical protein
LFLQANYFAVVKRAEDMKNDTLYEMLMKPANAAGEVETEALFLTYDNVPDLFREADLKIRYGSASRMPLCQDV